MSNKDQKLTGETEMNADLTSTPLTPATPPAKGGSSKGSSAGETAPTTAKNTKDAPKEVPKPSKVAGDAPVHHSAVNPTVAGTTWVGLIIGGIILILLLVFILQNGDTVQLTMFMWTWDFPIGVGMLIAAVAGALIAASVGTVRIFQLRRQVKAGR